MDRWVRESIAGTGGLAEFLERRARKWHQVGRVCFHLAENRNDAERPFAFMATYASGFGAAGRLTHLPLRRALEEYSGAKKRGALVKLLSPVHQAAEACDWVKELVDSGDIYRPMAPPSDGGPGLPPAAECGGARGERTDGAPAELVAPAAPPTGVGHHRCPDAVRARRGRAAGLRRQRRPGRRVAVSRRAASAARRRGRPGAAQGPMGSRWTETGSGKPSGIGRRNRAGDRWRRNLLPRRDATARRRVGGPPA